MENIQIVQVSSEELEILHHFSWQTFDETFSEFNSIENMQKFRRDNFSLHQITSEFYNKDSQFYFAKENEVVIGYLKLNFGSAQTELRESTGMEIERIYVLKKYHGKSVGKILFKKAQDIAQALKLDYLWLGVWEKNEKAIRFYEKNGLTIFDQHFFMVGDDEQTDLMMKVNLNK